MHIKPIAPIIVALTIFPFSFLLAFAIKKLFGLHGFAPKAKTFRCQPRVAHRNPPRSFFYKCNLQAAIDFAELRMRCWGVGANGGAHNAAHRADFWAMQFA